MSSTPSKPKTKRFETPDKTTGDTVASGTRLTRWANNLPPIAGFSVLSFLALFAVVLIAAAADIVPNTMLAAFGITMILGSLLNWIGQQVPVLKDFGLPIILCLLVPAVLVYWNIMPATAGTMMTEFYQDMGLIDYVVVAVIVGAIASLPRVLLMKILVRFIVPLAGVVVLVFALGAILGTILGYHWMYSLLFIVAPIMAGGLPMGALPMSEMYAAQLGTDSGDYISGLMSAVVLANTVCILFAALLNGIGKRVGKKFLGFNGEGQLLRIEGSVDNFEVQGASKSASYIQLAQGLMICGAVLLVGLLLADWLPFLHEYAWIVVVMAVIKMFNLFPESWNQAAQHWGDMVMSAFIPAFLVAISVAVIDINDIIAAMSDPAFVILVISCVALAGIVSAVLGWLVKFNAIEAAIAPGLIMADMGGSGDVAVLSAADRMSLMPFAAVATRFGGVLVLFITTLLVPMLTPAML